MHKNDLLSTNECYVRSRKFFSEGVLLIQVHFKDICGYFQCAPLPRLETGKVVWVLSFDH